MWGQLVAIGDWIVPTDEAGHHLLSNHMPLTEDEMRHAYVLAASHSFHLGVPPLLDLANTRASPHNVFAGRIRTNGVQEFCFVAMTDLQAGEELNVNYEQSKQSALSFFMQYGFALPPTSHRRTRDSLTFCNNLNHPELELLLMQQNGVARNIASFIEQHCNSLGVFWRSWVNRRRRRYESDL